MPNSGEGNEPKGNEDPVFKGWVRSTTKMLGCVDNKNIEACSISIVPDDVRKSNKDAYTPKVVSIGPLHRGTKSDLVYMEEFKWRCMMSLLHRTIDEDEDERCKCKNKDGSCDRCNAMFGKVSKSLNGCSKAIYKLEGVFRASYVDGLKLIDSYDFAKIMLLDGCFLLELLISNHETLSTTLKCGPASSPGPALAKKEDVLSDLIVLENQIPLLVLTTLFRKLFSDSKHLRTVSVDDAISLVKRLALSLFGYPSCPNIDTGCKANHMLEVLHSFVKTKDKPSSSTIIQVQQSGVIKRHEKLGLKRCTAKLLAAGVTIETPKLEQASQKYGVGFNFDIKFDNKTLVIPQLLITGRTEAKWRNFIAWEQNRYDRAQSIPPEQDEIRCKFSCYALFIQGLICCEHDIQLLRDRGVIVVDDAYHGVNQDNKKKKNINKELLLMFKGIAKVVDGDKVGMDSNFCQIFQKLNKDESTVNLFIEKFRVFWHYIRCFLTYLGDSCRKSYAILRLQYTGTVWKIIGIIYAAVLLFLTIAQVVLQAISM